jgi:hypothetical protein
MRGDKLFATETSRCLGPVRIRPVHSERGSALRRHFSNATCTIRTAFDLVQRVQLNMSETAEQYKARFAAYVEGKDPITMQRETPRTLAHLVYGVPAPELAHKPAPDKWSVTEILAHMAEDELSSTWRYRQMIEHDSPALLGFDQQLWSHLGDYASWKPQEALEMFRLLREANLRMFARLTPAHWQRHGVHAERGQLTVQDLCRHMAAHDMNHIDQIRKILSR